MARLPPRFVDCLRAIAGFFSRLSNAARMTTNHWHWLSHHSIPSDTSVATAVIDVLLARLQQDDWSDRDVFGVHLAVEEALVNAIKHGNQDDLDKHVQVEYRVAPDRVQIEIVDEGPGFDPDSVPDPTSAEQLNQPHGRGLMLMRSFMTRVEFHPPGNRVLLEKCRTAAAS